MSDPLANASNFIELSGRKSRGEDIDGSEVELLRYAVTELLRHMEEVRAGKPL